MARRSFSQALELALHAAEIMGRLGFKRTPNQIVQDAAAFADINLEPIVRAYPSVTGAEVVDHLLGKENKVLTDEGIVDIGQEQPESAPDPYEFHGLPDGAAAPGENLHEGTGTSAWGRRGMEFDEADQAQRRKDARTEQLRQEMVALDNQLASRSPEQLEDDLSGGDGGYAAALAQSERAGW